MDLIDLKHKKITELTKLAKKFKIDGFIFIVIDGDKEIGEWN